MIKINFFFFFSFAFLSCYRDSIHPNFEIVKPDLIWNYAPHNAFTDLCLYNNNFYLTFREASSHNSYDGKIRIISSTDFKFWHLDTLIQINGNDLRDPHFFVFNGELYLNIGCRKENIIFNVIYSCSKRKIVTKFFDKGYWYWHINGFRNKLYSIAYDDFNISLKEFLLSDSLNLLREDPNIANDNIQSSETSIIFDNDTAFAVTRRAELNKSTIGFSKYPFEKWTWIYTNYVLNSPCLISIPHKGLYLAGREIIRGQDYYFKISIFKINKDALTLEKLYEMTPGGNDCGYPGMAYKDNYLYVSFYSNMFHKCSIFTAAVNLEPPIFDD